MIHARLYPLLYYITRGVKMNNKRSLSLKNKKKAQGLSLTTVVIAALVLLVLVILSVIFVGRMSGYSWRSRDCEKKGATCLAISEGSTCKDQGMTPHSDGVCQKEGPDGTMVTDEEYICCININ